MDAYEDLIDLPRPDPKDRPRMSRIKRAFQFAPFSALTGYEEAVTEEGRRTESRPVLSDHMADLLNYRIQVLEAAGDRVGEVVLTVFEEDPLKTGGRLYQVRDRVLHVDRQRGLVHLVGRDPLPLKGIVNLEGDFFDAPGEDRVDRETQ